MFVDPEEMLELQLKSHGEQLSRASVKVITSFDSAQSNKTSAQKPSFLGGSQVLLHDEIEKPLELGNLGTSFLAFDIADSLVLFGGIARVEREAIC